jgi:hypothetical protein
MTKRRVFLLLVSGIAAGMAIGFLAGCSSPTNPDDPTPSSDANLANLVINGATLQPKFDPDTTSYTATVPYTVESVTTTAAASHSGAAVDNPAGAGQPLIVGGNTIAITVRAADGETTKTYTIVVTRQEADYQPSGDATLKTLTLSAGVLDPVFAAGTPVYAATVEHGISNITVTAEPNHPNAAVDNPAAAGKQLAVGSNTIEIIVRAEDGENTKTYTITVARAAPAVIPDAPVIRVKLGTTKLTVEWYPVPGATAYEVWYAPSFPGVDQTLQQSGGDISGTSHVITGLSYNYQTPTMSSRDDYKVLVYAKNSAGRSRAAEWNGRLFLNISGISVKATNDALVILDVHLSRYGSYTGLFGVVYVNTENNPATAWETPSTLAGSNDLYVTLANGVEYWLWVQIKDDAGNESDWSYNNVSATPRISSPTIFQVIPGDGSIEVDWDLIASADSYEVWRYESASGSPPGTKAAEGLPSGPYVITGLENGTEYTVYVTAKSEYDAANSDIKTATPRGAPATPAAPALTPGIGQIRVSWTASDPGVASYEIYYHTANDYAQAVKYGEVLVPGTSVVIKGLLHNTTYWVWLKAKNNVGSSYSAPASGTTPVFGAITVGFDGRLTVTDESGTDVSGGFALADSGSATLSADGGFADVNWHVDGGNPSAGNSITLSGASYNDRRDHSITFTGKKGGIFYSSDPIPFRVIP